METEPNDHTTLDKFKNSIVPIHVKPSSFLAAVVTIDNDEITPSCLVTLRSKGFFVCQPVLTWREAG